MRPLFTPAVQRDFVPNILVMHQATRIVIPQHPADTLHYLLHVAHRFRLTISRGGRAGNRRP